jgi:creatinine amidohydrolase
MHDKTVFLGELTRKELAETISSGTVQVGIVPTGATEQHQDHLAMIHDTASVTEIARRVAMRFFPRVLITPTISMSVSEHHMNRGGALTVRAEIHAEHLYDICHSLKRLGVPKVIVVNGHGGNKLPKLEDKAPEPMQKLKDLGVEYVTYWETIPAEFYEAHLDSDRSAGHAGEFETSFAMVAFPERIRPDCVEFESAKLATIPKGGLIMDAAVEGVAGEVQKLLDRD